MAPVVISEQLTRMHRKPCLNSFRQNWVVFIRVCLGAGVTFEVEVQKLMSADLSQIVGFQRPPRKISWTRKDTLLHAVGVGATKLQHVYEFDKNFHALPSLICSASQKGDSNDTVVFRPAPIPGLSFDANKLLHGEQYVELPRPLPVAAECTSVSAVLDLLDKGTGGLLVNETLIKRHGSLVARIVSTSFLRGVSPIKGARRKLAKDPRVPIPQDVLLYKKKRRNRPDAVVTAHLSEHQAILYRLSGDFNPLHIDPKVATSVGFRKPILHGLAGLSFCVRVVLETLAAGDATSVASYRCRFMAPVYPGEHLHVKMWAPAHSTCVLFEAWSRGQLVISGAVTFRSQTLTPKPKL